jgi:tRNA uridine 5-carboxymethylaminomethyl modification enzyme
VVGGARAAAHRAFAAAAEAAIARARAEGATPAAYAAAGVPVNADGRWRSLFEALSLPSAEVEALATLFPWLRGLPPRVLAHLEAEALYAPYLARHESERALLAREEALPIPPDLDFAAIAGLSNEMRDRLSRARPATLGGAGRLPGVTPAAVAALAVHLRRRAGVSRETA